MFLNFFRNQGPWDLLQGLISCCIFSRVNGIVINIFMTPVLVILKSCISSRVNGMVINVFYDSSFSNFKISFKFFNVLSFSEFNDYYCPTNKVLIELFSPLVFKCDINRNCFGDLYLWCEGRFLEIDLTPPPTHLHHMSPPNRLLHPRCAHLTSLQLI